MNEAPEVRDAEGLRPLDPRWITLRRRAAGVRALVYALLLAGVAALAVGGLGAPWGATWGAWFVVVGALIVAGQLWPATAYRYRSYRVDAWGVERRSGVIWRSVIVVPRSRVQHTDVSQGPFERQLGLATLSLYTAGTSHTEVSMDGLAHADALAIRDHLVHGQEGDAV